MATILIEPDIEGARAALALDGSVSMKKFYGISNVKNPLLAKASAPPNVMDPIARDMAKYLTRFTADASVGVIYWSCGIKGDQTEPVGVLTAATCDSTTFHGPAQAQWGRQTQLLPATRHFVEEILSGAEWGIGVIITDGEFNDLEAVQQYSLEVGRQIANGARRDLKLVLLGVCMEKLDPEAQRQQVEKMHEQLEVLDDMFEGSGLRKPDGDEVDIWDHKIAEEMRTVLDLFPEVVDENQVIAPTAKVYDDKGKVVADLTNGLISKVGFTMPGKSKFFELEIEGERIRQSVVME
ncbi:MAG: hypothetical protein ACQESR_02280 [Planctomycetota bacterium]